MNIQEKANINSVQKLDSEWQIRGYQNFNISKDKITPIASGKQHKWAITLDKWNVVNDVLKDLKIDTYMDIGCNLGLYVFSANVNHTVHSVGYDYNIDYIDVCNQVRNDLKMDCEFHVGSFSDIEISYDCVSALALFHHLYHRTETYGSLEPIIERFAGMVNKYLILEFPTEKDVKAMKWVNMPGRVKNEEYTEDKFKKYASKYFKDIQDVGRISKYRPIYLLTK